MGTKNRPRPAGDAPNQSALLSRIERLERDVEARSAAGKSISPAGRRFLEDYRKEATAARDANTRREVSKKLDSWESIFLGR